MACTKTQSKYLIKVSTLGSFPFDTAKCKGVHPLLSVIFTLLPVFNNSSKHDESPNAAA